MSISWGFAFKKAIIACIYQCGWAIVAGIIIFVGFIIGGLSIDFNDPNTFLAAMGVIIIFYVIGSAVCCLGSMASIIKAAGDAALQSR